jgi:hypothetical protein
VHQPQPERGVRVDRRDPGEPFTQDAVAGHFGTVFPSEEPYGWGTSTARATNG